MQLSGMHLCPNSSVDLVSASLKEEGEQQMTMVVRQFPPRESCRILVILLSLYGTYVWQRTQIRIRGANIVILTILTNSHNISVFQSCIVLNYSYVIRYRSRGWIPIKIIPLGGHDCLTEPSAKAEMTFPSEDRDLLIILASSSTVPSAPVLPTCKTQKHRRVCIIILEPIILRLLLYN